MKSRKSVLIRSVGTSFTELESPGWPDRFIILRVVAELLSGSGTEVAVSIRQRSNPTQLEDTVLEYDLTTDLDDEIRNGALCQPRKRKDTDIGSLYVAAKADSGSNNVVRITLEFEL